ncbi:unnamed protein product, partial [Musa acuminata subsp. burmannicoides]
GGILRCHPHSSTTVDLEVTKGRGTKKSILHEFRLWLGGFRPQMATFACSSAIAIAEGGEQKKGE